MWSKLNISGCSPVVQDAEVAVLVVSEWAFCPVFCEVVSWIKLERVRIVLLLTSILRLPLLQHLEKCTKFTEKSCVFLLFHHTLRFVFIQIFCDWFLVYFVIWPSDREAAGLRSRFGSREDYRCHRFHGRTYVPHEMVCIERVTSD